jgi:hypothetical protein
MTAFTGWQIDLVDGTGSTDITSFVQGFNTTTKANIGSFSTTTITLTLDNDDGDFTPAEGGGTGTYSSIDWLTQAIQISPAADTTKFSAFGFISRFRIRDNGTNSTVEMECRDWLSLAAGQQFDMTGSSSNIEFDVFFASCFDGSLGNPAPTLPDFGQPTYSTVLTETNRSYSTNVYAERVRHISATGVTAFDYVNQAMFNAYPSVIIPTDAAADNPFNFIRYNFESINRTLTYSESRGRQTFVFSENPTGTVLPFIQLQPAFNHDQLTNTTTVESAVAGVTAQTATNTATGNAYGSRARFYTGTGNPTETDNSYDAGALEAAQFWTSRQGQARYTPQTLTTSIELIDDRNSTAAATVLMDLMAAKKSMFQVCSITYTPTAGSQVTANCVISGRTIQAVPGRTTITLDLLPAQDYQSFVLDSDTLGVLDTNRLG